MSPFNIYISAGRPIPATIVIQLLLMLHQLKQRSCKGLIHYVCYMFTSQYEIKAKGDQFGFITLFSSIYVLPGLIKQVMLMLGSTFKCLTDGKNKTKKKKNYSAHVVSQHEQIRGSSLCSPVLLFHRLKMGIRKSG